MNWHSAFSRLNDRGVYLKLGLVDPAFIRTRRLSGARRLFIKCIFQPSFCFLLSVVEVFWIMNQISTKTLKSVEQCHQLLSYLSESGDHLAKNITDRNSDWTPLNVTIPRDTLRKCIGNGSTANLLCKQFRIEKGKIMERFKELLENRWRNPRDDPRLMDTRRNVTIILKRDCWRLTRYLMHRLFHLL